MTAIEVAITCTEYEQDHNDDKLNDLMYSLCLTRVLINFAHLFEVTVWRTKTSEL